MKDGDAWWNAPVRAADRMMKDLSAKARKMLRMLRIGRVVVLLLLLVPLVLAGLTFWKPFLATYTLAVLALYVAVPLIGVFVVLGLPLKAKSVIRLIEKGYPGNVKELAIRAAARKLHEQSIETEELLVDTAVNESKKLVKKYKARAQRLKAELDAADEEE